MSAPQRFCRDCKYYKPAGAVAFYGASIYWPASCSEPEKWNLVTGDRIPGSPERMRAREDSCGPGGKFWSPAPPKDAA